jgi:hypothetical protein
MLFPIEIMETCARVVLGIDQRVRVTLQGSGGEVYQ